MPLKLAGGLFRETFSTLRECGAGQDECVVYWAGPVDRPGRVDRVIHPVHLGRPGYYEIAAEWLNEIWFTLNSERIEIRAQVHTHRGLAFHSQLDDDFPFLQTAGFLSLVLPRFALGPVGLDGAYLVELTATGGWHELDPLSAIEGV